MLMFWMGLNPLGGKFVRFGTEVTFAGRRDGVIECIESGKQTGKMKRVKLFTVKVQA